MSIGYVTVAEADAYIGARYLANDLSRAIWDALDDASKSVYLLRSVEALDQLPYQGRKALSTQAYAFPRYRQAEVPNSVKAAQVENALKLSDSSSSADAELYSKMRMFGVESYSIGNLSENLGGGPGLSSAIADIVSDKALSLLQPFLGGGYRFK